MLVKLLTLLCHLVNLIGIGCTKYREICLSPQKGKLFVVQTTFVVVVVSNKKDVNLRLNEDYHFPNRQLVCVAGVIFV